MQFFVQSTMADTPPDTEVVIPSEAQYVKMACQLGLHPAKPKPKTEDEKKSERNDARMIFKMMDKRKRAWDTMRTAMQELEHCEEELDTLFKKHRVT